MGFFKRREEDKLYQQWSKHAALPPEDIPQREVSRDIPVTKEKREMNPRVLYILLGVAIVILCIGLVLLFILS